MGVPDKIIQAIAAVGGEITKAEPVCEGSSHWIIEFTTKGSVSRGKLAGEESLAKVGRTESGAILYRAHFTKLTAQE